MLRIFLDPLLDALGKLGTNAYMPLLRTDRCLQLLVRLLRSSVPRGSSGQDGEDDWALGCLSGCCWALGCLEGVLLALRLGGSS